MTKDHLVKAVHANTEVPLTLNQSRQAVEAIFGTMTREMSRGNCVIINGLGRWRIRQKNGRAGRNPRTGEIHWVRPRRVVSWKASMKLKGIVNNGR